MEFKYTPTSEEVRRERQRRYLEGWPVEKQLEAYSEAMMGRPEKQERMMDDFRRIRADVKYPGEV